MDTNGMDAATAEQTWRDYAALGRKDLLLSSILERFHKKHSQWAQTRARNWTQIREDAHQELALRMWIILNHWQDWNEPGLYARLYYLGRELLADFLRQHAWTHKEITMSDLERYSDKSGWLEDLCDAHDRRTHKWRPFAGEELLQARKALAHARRRTARAKAIECNPEDIFPQALADIEALKTAAKRATGVQRFRRNERRHARRGHALGIVGEDLKRFVSLAAPRSICDAARRRRLQGLEALRWIECLKRDQPAAGGGVRASWDTPAPCNPPS